MINAVVEKQNNSSSANGCSKNPKVEIEILEKQNSDSAWSDKKNSDADAVLG